MNPWTMDVYFLALVTRMFSSAGLSKVLYHLKLSDHIFEWNMINMTMEQDSGLLTHWWVEVVWWILRSELDLSNLVKQQVFLLIP